MLCSPKQPVLVCWINYYLKSYTSFSFLVLFLQLYSFPSILKLQTKTKISVCEQTCIWPYLIKIGVQWCRRESKNKKVYNAMQQQAKKGIQKNETVTKNSSVFQEHKTMLPSLLNSDIWHRKRFSRTISSCCVELKDPFDG